MKKQDGIKHGFSLMEMMIVLLIVSIIAAASAPMVSKKLGQSTLGGNDSTCFWQDAGTKGIRYNTKGSSDAVVGIGSSSVESSRLYIHSNSTSIPQIAFGYSSNNSIKLLATSNTISIGSNLPNSNYSAIMGCKMEPRGEYVTMVGYNNAAAQSAIAIGCNANASGKNSTAVGTSSEAISDYAIGLGYHANASGRGSIAIGGLVDSSNYSRGAEAEARGLYSIAMGTASEASGEKSTALGVYSWANGLYSVALGTNAVSNNVNTVAVGSNSIVSGSNSVAIGTNSEASSANSTALGYYAYATGNNSTALGNNTTASGNISIALGNGANASGSISIALGDEANAYGGGSIALGLGAKASGDHSIALGERANASAHNSTALGFWAIASGDHSIALGNWAQATYPYSAAIGYHATTHANNQIVLGTKSDTVYIPGNLVVGNSVVLNADNSSALTAMRLANYDNSVSWVIEGYEVNGHKGVLHRCGTGANVTDGCITGMTTSDRRLKNIGEKFVSGLESIKKLEPFNYTFKNDPEKTPRVGVIAQDLKKIFPEAVFKGEDGFYRIRTEDIFYALVNAVKELDTMIRSSSSEIAELKKLVNIQNEKIATLEERNKKFEEQNKKFEEQNKKLEERIAKLEKVK